MMTCKTYYRNIYVFKLLDTDDMNNDILRQKKYSRVEKIKLDFSTEITDISCLKNLKILILNSIHNPISQDQIDHMNLTELRLFENKNINRISHMKNLRILHIVGDCTINQEEIDKLNLYELNMSCNPNIHCLTHMNKLKNLYAKCGRYSLGGPGSNECKKNLTRDGIKNLDLNVLDIEGNLEIIDVSSFRNLNVLDISIPYSPINQSQIDHMNLTELKLLENKNIFRVSHMPNLRVLHIVGRCAIKQDEISKLNLYELNISFNTDIYYLRHMSNLRKLYANCGPHYIIVRPTETDSGYYWCPENIELSTIQNLDLHVFHIHGHSRLVMEFDKSTMKNLIDYQY